MYDRMQALRQEDMTKLHEASMVVLRDTGVAFNDPESLGIFKKHGFKVTGNTVFFTEKDVLTAVEKAPAKFTVTARDPGKSVIMGGEDFVFAPGYGPPFVADLAGEQRPATMKDYDNLCKLVQDSKHIDMNGFMMVEPADVPVETAHLDMLLSSITLCDKVFMGAPISKRAARDTVEMAAIVWGKKERIIETPVTVSLITPVSPLRFSEEMAGSIVELARGGQACLVSAVIMAGATGPVTLPGVLTLQNAEILAGLTLAQLVRAGAPVIYGSISCPMDMRTGNMALGAPEFSIIASATVQMARLYNLPSRSGGALTDAHVPDAQAGVESALTLSTAARNGAHFILEACGILGAFISMSFEKFVLDEEICGMIRRFLQPMEIVETEIDLETMKSVGIGGQYLTELKTVERCETAFYLPAVFRRQNQHSWHKDGAKSIDKVASEIVTKRLAAYEKPKIDTGMEEALAEYVSRRREGRQ
jgi:trimethylamine--corrinoid protein Co-methyltransferase